MPEQNNRWMRLWRAVDGALYRLMNTRVTLVLLLLAGAEALASPFAGWHWALVSIATSAAGVGLVISGTSLWASAVGTAAQRIAAAYEKENNRGAESHQSNAAAVQGRIN